MVVGLYDGGTTNTRFPLLKGDAPPAAVAVSNNDAPTQPTTAPQSGTSAYAVPSFTAANTYTGNLSSLTSNLSNKDRAFDQSPMYGGDMCDASPAGIDAWFTFTLTGTRTINIEASDTDFVSEHTLAGETHNTPDDHPARAKAAEIVAWAKAHPGKPLDQFAVDMDAMPDDVRRELDDALAAVSHD